MYLTSTTHPLLSATGLNAHMYISILLFLYGLYRHQITKAYIVLSVLSHETMPSPRTCLKPHYTNIPNLTYLKARPCGRASIRDTPYTYIYFSLTKCTNTFSMHTGQLPSLHGQTHEICGREEPVKKHIY